MAVTTTTAPQVIINRMTKQQYDSATKSATEFYVITDTEEYVTTTTNQDVDGAKKFLDPVTIQNGAGTGSLIVGGDVNDDTLTNNTRKLGRINSPSYASGSTPTATLLGWDTSGDSDMHTINNDKDAVCFGGMKKITTNTSPLNIVFCVANARGATAEENKVYALELDANQARFNVQPNYNGNNLLTSADLPTKISDLTDDTATYPVDQADTLTGLTASVSELNILDGATLTTTELNYVDGVTSNIQTQLNAKATDTDVVHKSGDENISDLKTFEKIKIINGEASYVLNQKATNLATNNTTPADNDVLREYRVSANNDTIVGGYRVVSKTDGKTENRIYARRTIDGTTKEAGITLTVDSNGNTTTSVTAPTQDTTSSTQIDTVGARNTKLQGYQTSITGAATTITSSNLTASKALVSDANGKVAASSVTSTELGYLSGVTSAIQTQLNGKQVTLVSGTNIKTINSNSILGSGNLELDTIPVQTGHSGKVLTTNGTTASWGYSAVMREWVD